MRCPSTPRRTWGSKCWGTCSLQTQQAKRDQSERLADSTHQTHRETIQQTQEQMRNNPYADPAYWFMYMKLWQHMTRRTCFMCIFIYLPPRSIRVKLKQLMMFLWTQPAHSLIWYSSIISLMLSSFTPHEPRMTSLPAFLSIQLNRWTPLTLTVQTKVMQVMWVWKGMMMERLFLGELSR